MNTSAVIEIVGYIGSALVLISFLMASVVKLRIVNAVGSLIFAVYALIIRSYPTALMNVCLVAINLRFLWKLRSKAPEYRLLRLAPGERFVEFFLQSHGEDIAAFFPERSWKGEKTNRAFMVCHGDAPAGLLLGTQNEDVLEVALDYSTPAYRDASVGRYLVKHLPGEGVKLLRYANAEEAHVEYLKKLGFELREGVYEKRLDAEQ